jgi:hypothetical protein
VTALGSAAGASCKRSGVPPPADRARSGHEFARPYVQVGLQLDCDTLGGCRQGRAAPVANAHRKLDAEHKCGERARPGALTANTSKPDMIGSAEFPNPTAPSTVMVARKPITAPACSMPRPSMAMAPVDAGA